MLQLRFRHIWIAHGEGSNHHDKPGRWTIYPETREASELWNFLRIDLEYDRDQVVYCIEALDAFKRGDIVQGFTKKGYAPPGEVTSGNDGALFYGNEHVLMASDYVDHERVVMTADELRKILHHILTTMDHPDYRNPDIDDPFDPVTVDIIAFGEDSLGEYFKRGGITPVIPEEFR